MPILVEFNTLEQNIQLCNELGLDFIELNLDVPYCFIENIDTNIFKNNNFTIHLSEKIDVGELNNNLRNFYIQEIERIISIGSKAKINKYNLHIDPGIHFSLPDKKIFIYQQYLEQYISSYEDSCKKLSEIATKYNVMILFENVKMESYTSKAIEVISRYDNLFFTLDLGHNIRYGNTAKQEFLKYSNKIKHIHMHDYNGNKDHQELFTGNLDVQKELSFCEENNLDVVVEVKRKNELVNSIKKLNNLNYINN